jgi:hypothetical protein
MLSMPFNKFPTVFSPGRDEDTTRGVAATFGQECRVLWGFLFRNMATALSYRSEVFFNLASILAWAVTVGLVGMFVTRYTNSAMTLLLQSCPDYGTFLTIGFVVQLLVWSARGNVSWLVRSRQFPSLFMAPRHLLTIILGANMWKYVWIVVQVLLFILISSLLFGVRFHFNAGFAVVILGGMLLMTAFDMLGAAFRIITKSETDPFNWILSTTSLVFSARIFPVEMLPPWVQPIARIHPEYYINTFARRTMGGGAELTEVWPELISFLVLTFALLLVSFGAFRFGFYRARVEGTLGHQ